MAEPLPPLPPLDGPEHSDAWTFAYLDGELSLEDKARFEEHCKSHEACRVEVETMRAALPAFVRVLMEDGPPRPIAEVLKIAEAAEAKLAVKARPRRGPRWALGAGFAALASAAAAYFVLLQPVAWLEPTLLEAAVLHAPRAEAGDAGPEPEPPPPPVHLVFTTALRSGGLELEVLRDPGDTYSAVALIDARRRMWLAKAGNIPDVACTPTCPALNLHLKLDEIAPGPFRVVALVSAQPIVGDDLRGWLPMANETPPLWLGARAYAVVTVER